MIIVHVQNEHVDNFRGFSVVFNYTLKTEKRAVPVDKIPYREVTSVKIVIILG